MITSKDNSQYKWWGKLQQKKYRQKEQLFLVEGLHLAVEAKKNNVLVEVLVREGTATEFEEITILKQDLFDKLAGTVNSAGVMAVCRMVEAKITNFERLLLVDGVQDPGNLGTLIRSALAFGFDGIVISEDTVDVYNEKVVRATQGAIFALPIIRRDLIAYVEELQKAGVQVYAATLNDNAKPLNAVSTADKMAFIVGNEGAGIRADLIATCKNAVIIEMASDVESLNVGVAGSILMYQFRKI
jgi:TrmH family RNA methyltransferase